MGLITASSTNFDLPHNHMVIGYYIYDIMDKDVADIRDLLVDSETRQPRYAMIEIGGLMAIKGKIVLIPWAALAKSGMSRMDIKWPEEHIMSAPVPHDPLAPKRAEEEFIHSFFNVEPYWWAEEADEEEGGKEGSDSAAGSAPKPDDETTIENLTLENEKSD